MNGYELIRQVRTFSNLPILILSARTMDADKVLGLDIGADAYLTKPFNALEVVAYVKAALRRYYELGAEQAPHAAPQVLTVGALTLDTEQFILRKKRPDRAADLDRAQDPDPADALPRPGVHQGAAV